jgi:hypothetical protein
MRDDAFPGVAGGQGRLMLASTWLRRLAALSACLMVALSGCGYSPSSSLTGLTASPGSVSFGSVPVGQTATTLVVLLNQTSSPIPVSQVSVSGQNFFVSGQGNAPITIAPGAVLNVEMGFTPNSSASYSGQFKVEGTKGLSLFVGKLSGQGISGDNSGQKQTAVLSTDTTNLAFGNLAVGSASMLPLTLRSTGSKPVTVSAATVTGSGFSVSGSFPQTLNPGTSLALQVQFSPAQAGSSAGTLTLESDSAGGNVVVNLTGSGTATTPVASTPQLTVSATTLVFGNVTVGSSSSQPVTLTSTGTAPVTITSGVLTGSAFSAPGTPFPITLNPNQSVTVDVVFDPSTAGPASGQMTLQSNSSTNSTAIIELSGTGTAAPSPQLTLSAASLTFGNVTVNSTSAQPLTLTSTGTAPVTIRSAAITGAGFAIPGTAFPVTLGPGQTLTLNIQLTPKAAGAISGLLTIQSNSGTNGTATVSLNGIGTAAPSPQLTLSAANMTFGNVNLNTPSAEPLTLSSTGTAAVTVQSATVTGAGFSISGSNFPLILSPGQTVTLNVSFDPTVSGAATGQLLIQSNSSTNGTPIVRLSGTGVVPTVIDPELTVTPASLPFGNVSVNTASGLAVTLTSTGTAPVVISSASLTGSGFTMSGATFPLTLNPMLAVVLNIQFDPASAGPASGQLIITSNSGKNSTVNLPLTGTGVALSHQVTLTWAAGDTTDPLAGYNVYRATGSSTNFALLNAALDTDTTYVDTAVQSGTTYEYVVTSVDSAGIESAASNQASATVP